MTLGVVSALLPSLGQAEDLLTALGTDHPAPLFDDLLANDRYAGLRPMFAAFSLDATETTMVIPAYTPASELDATAVWDAVHEAAHEAAEALAANAAKTDAGTMAARPRA